MIPAFRGANVMALLDGTDQAPAKMIEVEDTNQKKIQVGTLHMFPGLHETSMCFGFSLIHCPR
jgi:hypothetical protein